MSRASVAPLDRGPLGIVLDGLPRVHVREEDESSLHPRMSHLTTCPLMVIGFPNLGVNAKGFYGIADVSGGIHLPSWLKPAIGGVMVGGIALVIPEVLGTGYGWVQQSLDQRLLSLPLWIVLILPFARILATGLSIGSGGSGGTFGPGLVIGAFIGASVWRLFEPIVPSMGHNPAPYVIVGMMCCFGGISRAPLAVMLMVAEMTGNLSLLAPAMVAVGLAWFIVRRSDDTIYRSQLKSRADAPAQRLLLGCRSWPTSPCAKPWPRPSWS